MTPRTKFLIGGVLILGAAAYLMASAIRNTGVYYLTPRELAGRVAADPGFANTGVKVGARVVPGGGRRADLSRGVSRSDPRHVHRQRGRDRGRAYGARRDIPGDDPARE